MPASTLTHKRRDGARLFDIYMEIFRKRTILTTIVPHWHHQHHQCHHHHHPHHPKCNDCIGKNGDIDEGSEKGKGMDSIGKGPAKGEPKDLDSIDEGPGEGKGKGCVGKGSGKGKTARTASTVAAVVLGVIVIVVSFIEDPLHETAGYR